VLEDAESLDGSSDEEGETDVSTERTDDTGGASGSVGGDNTPERAGSYERLEDNSGPGLVWSSQEGVNGA
jgi:hypothetical protein